MATLEVVVERELVGASDPRTLIQQGLRQYDRPPIRGLPPADWIGIKNILLPAEIDSFLQRDTKSLDAYQTEYGAMLQAIREGNPAEASRIFSFFDAARQSSISQLLFIARQPAVQRSWDVHRLCIQLAQDQMIWSQDIGRWLENKTPRPLLQLGNPLGRRLARTVDFGSDRDKEEVAALKRDMMSMNEAIVHYYESSNKPSFLHAAQIGSDLDVICMRHQPSKEQPATYVFIVNPQLHWIRDGQKISANEIAKQSAAEGCYAFFEGRVTISRPMPDNHTKLVVTGLDIYGNKVELLYDSSDPESARLIQSARLVQHEWYHGQGWTVVDQVKNPATDIQLDLIAYYRAKYAGQDNAEAKARKSAAEAMALVFFLKRVPKRGEDGVYYIPGPGGKPLELNIVRPFDKENIISAIQAELAKNEA